MALHSALSAGTYVALKRSLVELPAMEVILVRYAGASVIFLPLLWRLRVRVAREDLLALVGLAVLAVPVNQGLLLVGLERSTAGHAALLYALTPIFVFLIARSRLGERTSRAKVAGIAIAFVGVAVVLLAGGKVSWSADSPWVGDLLILGAVVAWAVYAVWGKTYAERYGAVAFSGLTVLLGALTLVPFALLSVRLGRFGTLTGHAWGALAFLVVVSSMLAYVMYYWAMARTDASRVAIWANVQPVFAALLSWSLYGERITGSFLAGGAMVIAGVVLTQRG